VDGFSAGLVDDDNILEWQIVIMGYVRLSYIERRGIEADHIPSFLIKSDHSASTI
jgi:hypothetical protein